MGGFAKKRQVRCTCLAQSSTFYPHGQALLILGVDRLWHEDLAQRKQPLVARIELVVMLEDQGHELFPVDEAQVAF
jgi:hypothetical protein